MEPAIGFLRIVGAGSVAHSDLLVGISAIFLLPNIGLASLNGNHPHRETV